MTFDQITAYGQDRWLEELRQELRAGDYRPQPLLRVWIPKSNGGQRPLGIPCIRDRVVEMATMRHLMTRLGLTVNEAKTRLARLPEENFLGFSIGRFYGKNGMPFIRTRPSRKAVRRLLQRIHDATTPHKHAESPELRVAAINRLLRGWAEYFNQGPVLPTYRLVQWYVQRRLQRWLVRRSGQAGTGYRQYPDEYLYETLGLYALPRRRTDPPSAKA
jgi:RNA-directed DNA polymerase